MSRPAGAAAGAVAVVGGGPAGLMAAEVLAAAGWQVDVYDAMPSVGRKFLLAGKGGLNLTHAESDEAFAARYGARREPLEPLLNRFGAAALREWSRGLGIETFVGSSGHVFPLDLKSAPLLRAWLHRLRGSGVRFHMRHRWVGFAGADVQESGSEADAGAAFDADASRRIATPPPPPLRFVTPNGPRTVQADAVLLALGGASWPQLGSDGQWQPWLRERGVDVAPLVPSNCGFDVARVSADGVLRPGWSEFLRGRFAGAPLKNVALSVDAIDALDAVDGDGEGEGEGDGDGEGEGEEEGGGMGDGEGRVAGSAAATRTVVPRQRHFTRVGEFVVSASGVEGSLVYAASALLRDTIAARGHAVAWLDLLPARSAEWVNAEVARPRGSRSLGTHLKSRLGLDGVKAALLHELLPREAFADAAALAAAIKALPLTLVAPRPIAEAISSAGGVRFEALDGVAMLRALPGVFCAGEMLDWEAPTGGYLLTACFASGAAAAAQVVDRGRPIAD